MGSVVGRGVAWRGGAVAAVGLSGYRAAASCYVVHPCGPPRRAVAMLMYPFVPTGPILRDGTLIYLSLRR